MGKTVTILVFIFSVLLSFSLRAQPPNSFQNELSAQKSGVSIDFSTGDTTFLDRLIHGDLLRSPMQNFFLHRDSTEEDFWTMPDSTDDSLLLDLKMGDFSHHKKNRNHSFLITNPPYDREIPHLESMPFMDFNRVNGFYLGIATPLVCIICNCSSTKINAVMIPIASAYINPKKEAKLYTIMQCNKN